MNKVYKPSQHELDSIEQVDQSYRDAIENIKTLNQYKVGDFLVYRQKFDEGGHELVKNSYGAIRRYEVTVVSKMGAAFVLEINKAGKAFGDLVPVENDLEYGTWELDPSYADSLLLQDEYDPAVLHRAKSDQWKEITEHNKVNKIKTNELKTIVAFFSQIKVGDTLWSSSASYLLVQEKKLMPKKDAIKFVKYSSWRQCQMRSSVVELLTVIDKKGKIKHIMADHFLHKALYKERPRSYKELNVTQ